MAYDKTVDYQAEIEKAVAKGDYQAAAKAEQARNEKIKDLGLSYSTTNNYGSYLSSSSGGSSGKSSSSGSSNNKGSATGVVVNTNEQQKILDQMNKNSIEWHNATPERKQELEKINRQLGAQLGGSVSFDTASGTWSGMAEYIPEFNFDLTSGRPSYSSDYSSRIDDMLNQILNREDFSYDLNTDPLYAQYQTQYNREGNRAMNDTLAAAASGAGGMNSYAVTAAQQANDYYNAQLMDKIPELYQIAYNMYLTDIDNQVRDLGLLQNMDDRQYSRYRDTISDWENDRNFAYNLYRDDMGDYQWNKSFEYNAGRDQINDERYENEWNYSVDQNERETAYNQAMDFLSMGIMPDDDILAAAGITKAQAEAIRQLALAEMYGSGSSGSGGGSGRKSSGGSSGSRKSSGKLDYSSLTENGRKVYNAVSQWNDRNLSDYEKALYISGRLSDGTITQAERDILYSLFGLD